MAQKFDIGVRVRTLWNGYAGEVISVNLSLNPIRYKVKFDFQGQGILAEYAEDCLDYEHPPSIPKFKVGDRVVGKSSGLPGTILSIPMNHIPDPINIRYDDGMLGFCEEDDIELEKPQGIQSGVATQLRGLSAWIPQYSASQGTSVGTSVGVNWDSNYYPAPIQYKVCECGACKVKDSRHSTWCPLHE